MKRKILSFIAVLVLTCVSVFSIPSPREVFTQAKYYEAMYRDFPIGIAFIEGSGKFLYANNIPCSFLGRSEDELRRTTWQDITARQDIDAGEAVIKKIMSGEERSSTIFKQYIHKRGDALWARLTVVGIKNEDGTFSHLVSIVEPLSNSTFFEADINKKLEEIKTNLGAIKSTTENTSGFGFFLSNNWSTIIPWFMAVIITIGGILFRIQMDSKKIQDLEEAIREKNDKPK